MLSYSQEGMPMDREKTGITEEEQLDVALRALVGDFKAHDIIRIPSLIVIDRYPGGEYGKAHELYQHLYLVVGQTDRMIRRPDGKIAHTDLQLVLLDGVHNSRERYRETSYNKFPLIPAGKGVEIDTEANTDRVIYVTKELLLAREAVGVSRLNDRKIYDEIQIRSIREGKRKSNYENLRFMEEKEHGR